MEAAVVSASHGAMGSLLGKLGDLLTARYNLLKEAKGQIMFLQAELESIYAFLKRISDAEEPAEQDKCWAKQVRELSYDIEDSVNEFMLRVEHKCSSKPHGFKGFIKRSMNLLTTMNTRHDIAKEFEGLKIRVKEVSERRARYKLDGDAVKPNNTAVSFQKSNTAVDHRLLALHAETASLIGVTGPRDQLIKLMDEKVVPAHQLKVLSIVGFGGLGKTTLANEIYRKLGNQFQCRAFVSVSQKPNIGKILRTILSELGFRAPMDSNFEIWGESELISALKSFLVDKRYFIVIDDLWEDSPWDIIKCALPKNKNGSRVITTTRIETVARACCTDHIEYVYEMKPLNEEDSRRLFFKRMFGSEDACPSYLKEVSAEILKKCGGLPLAINTISSLLASHTQNNIKEYWEYVRNSLGTNFDVSPSLDAMRQILNLSYINLPHYLKACMLYLGIYPEDHTIHKNDLAREWVAEGFISKGHGMDPEDIARSYFNELINRRMIQPSETSCNGEVISCRVHDMMLDLILHKSREDNFITVVDDMQQLAEQQDKIRRLSVNLVGARDDIGAGSVQLTQTRTVAIFGIMSQLLPSLAEFKHLRVLIIEDGSKGEFRLTLLDLNGICHLFQLRCLRIKSRNHRAVLPSKIGGLHQLETFAIDATIEPSEGLICPTLPSDIVHMNRLLHLIVPETIIFPSGFGNMKSLRTLHCFNLENSVDNFKGLRELTNLTNLQIKYERAGFFTTLSNDDKAARCREVLLTCLEKLCNLKRLVVHVSSSRDACLDMSNLVPASFHCLQIFHVFDGTWFSRVPHWIGQLHSLYDLVLHVKEVLEGDVGIIAQLPSLVHVRLNIQGRPKEKMVFGSGFPILKFFEVSCSRIPYLVFEAGAMPKLERLHLCFKLMGCDRYSGAAPSGIEHLLSLKEISAYIGVHHANESNIRATTSTLRKLVCMHPGRPNVNIWTVNEYFTGSDEMFDELDEDWDDEGSCRSTS
uniref:NB-ARC domain-containing protein n=1 Tax=Leersia perrieri TaxID=77586 RepID=A0A0D9X0L4_9ORYZ